MLEQNLTALKQGTELFSKVYGNEIRDEVFYHKHFDNPDALSTPYIIETRNGAPVAMRWLMKVIFKYGTQSMYGVQSSDDAVLDEARGLLFLKMRKKTLATLKQENIDFEYGCFYPGEAMEIAEKCGEKNVVNLQMARYFSNEKIHKWKRFDLYIPRLLRRIILKKRISVLSKIACNTLAVSVSLTCPFTPNDYQIMNSGDELFIERSDAYYHWKTSAINDLYYVTARDNDELSGFLIIKECEDHAVVADWDVYGDDKAGIIASMLLSVCEKYQYIDIPSLNVENGEMDVYVDSGCKDMSRLWAPICICAKAITEGSADVIYDATVWKHRLIDADYFMNGE